MSARAVAQSEKAAAPERAPAHLVFSRGARTDGILRRTCACGRPVVAGGECAECRRKRETIRRAAQVTTPVPSVPAVVYDVLRTLGRPLDLVTQSAMGRSFGRDFSRVRVHTDAPAAESARAVGAQAYTVGGHIVFGAGRYAPRTHEGLQLLAHELVHTVQDRTPARTFHGLEVGQPDDRAEREAARTAGMVATGGTAPQIPSHSGPSVLRRMPDEPKPLRSDVAHLPAPGQGQGARIDVIRKLIECECRRVPDVREGVFWNPNLNAFAIAYRHCRGGTTVDVYGQVQSNLSSFLSGGSPPTGTATLGFEINVFGRSVGGRATLEVLGSTVSGSEGVGGRAQVVFQGGRWRIFVTTGFLHRLGAKSGDVLDFNLGARLGPITVEAQASDVLSPTPRGTGAGCVDIFGGAARLCATISAGGGRGVTPGIELRGTFGGPEVRREDCYQCLCPPPAKRFECYLDIPPTERPVTREVEMQVEGENRYYFRLDRPTPAEESELRARSGRSLDAVAHDVAAGGQVVAITGYASPEATEAHNQPLSERRAEALANLVRSRVPAGTPLPPPSGGGELLGRQPSPAPTSRLGEAIHAHGFRAAEDITVLLLGQEIPPPELSDQFVSLFRALPDSADRLALFGLAPDDPLAPRILGAIQEFLAHPRAGARPWERVFRLFRVGVVRTSRPERRTVTETERTTGSLTPLAENECPERGAEAERKNLLPPVPGELRAPRRGREDRDIECTIDVRPADRSGGCSYEFPPDMRLRPSAPGRAPRLLQ